PSPISNSNSIRSSRVNSVESISTQSASGFSTDGGSGRLQPGSATQFYAWGICMDNISLGNVANTQRNNARGDSEGRVSNLDLRVPWLSMRAAKPKSPTSTHRAEKQKRISSPSSSSSSKEKKVTP